MNFSSLFFAINTIIFTLFLYRVKELLKKEELRNKYTKKTKKPFHNLLAEYFFKTVLILMISYLTFSLGLIFFSANRDMLRVFKIIGDFFLFSSFAYGLNIPLSLKFPKVNRKVIVSSFLVLFWLLVTYQAFNFPIPPEVINGIVFWNLNPIVSWILLFSSLAMWIPTGAIFLIDGLRFKDKDKSTKSILLSLSFLITGFFAPVQVLSKNSVLIILSLVLMAAGLIFLCLGMFYKGYLPKKE